jgi:hypothetical protein
MGQFQTKLGTTRAGVRTRIWIEGARLVAAGFNVGCYFTKEWDAKARTLRLVILHCDGTAEKLRELGVPVAKVSGKGTKPIIDITGALVAATFEGTHVCVDYTPNLILIGECK